MKEDIVKQGNGAVVSGKQRGAGKSKGFRLLSERLLIPSLLLSANLSNEPKWFWAPGLGQLLGWAAILFTAFIVISAFRGKVWVLLLVAFVLLSKALQVILQADAQSLWFAAYIILYGCMLSLAAAVMITSNLDLVYKQLYVVSLVSIVFMFLQVSGIADWSQFAATHQDDDVVSYPVAFFDTTSYYDITQRRPSGFMYSNQFLCIIILFALVLHFSRNKKSKLAASTLVMCLFLVLSMAKLVFLGFILIGLYAIFMGTRYQRRTILRGFAITALLLYIHSVIFPGIFESNMKVDQLIFSFSTRLSNILLEYGAEDTFNMLQDLAKQSEARGLGVKIFETKLDFEERVSGYVDLIRILPIVIGLLLVILPFYVKGLSKMRAWFPDLTALSIMSLIIAALIPSAGSLWGNPVYLYICGFALFPLFVLLQRRYFEQIGKTEI